MRRKALLGLVAAGALCSLTALSVTASAATPAAPLSGTDVARIEQLMATAPFDRGTWGLLVTDLATGEELYRLNATEQFQVARLILKVSLNLGASRRTVAAEKLCVESERPFVPAHKNRLTCSRECLLARKRRLERERGW